MSAITKTWVETVKSQVAGRRRPTYRARWQDEYGKHGKSGFTSKTRARQYLDELRGQSAMGEYVSPAVGTMTLRDWLSQFIQRTRLKPSTQRSYQATIAAYVDRRLTTTPEGKDRALSICLGDYRLSELNLHILSTWKIVLSAQTATSGPNVGRPLAPRTVYQAIAVVRKALNDAVAMELIRSNPLPKHFAPAAPDPDTNIFETLEEFETFLSYVDPHWHPLIETTLWHGLRWSEAVGLQKQYVDLRRKELRVEETLVNGRRDTPKSQRSHRVIPLHSRAAGKIQKHIAETGLRQPTDLVFLTPAGADVDYSNFMHKVWRPAIRRMVEEHGLDRRLTPHSLRHTYGTWLLQHGNTQVDVVKDLLGHQSITTTERYVHATEARKRQAVSALEEMA